MTVILLVYSVTREEVCFLHALRNVCDPQVDVNAFLCVIGDVQGRQRVKHFVPKLRFLTCKFLHRGITDRR